MDPALAIVLAPPKLVRELAAAVGMPLDDLVPAMGMLPPNHYGVSAGFAWDIHHEPPVTDPEDLGRRALTRYSVHFVSGRAALPATSDVVVRPLGEDGFVLEWPPPVVWASDLAERVRAATTPEALAALAPLPAKALLAGLGAPDAYAQTVDVHMSHWEIRLTHGAWRIVATLAGRASGPDVPGVQIPAARAAYPGPDDVVSSLRVE